MLLNSLRLSNQIKIPYKIIRCLTGLVPTIPSNLHLQDQKVLDKEIIQPSIANLEYLFPTLKIQKSIKITKFSEPGKFEELEARLDPRIFGVAIRKDIVHEVIRYQRHAMRQPHKTKRMSEIAGSNKKPRPQKGGGQSQVGHKRNSVWRGGQKAFGPVIRDFSIGMNKKTRAMGTMITLAAKLRENNLIIIDQLTCQTLKTKDLALLLKGHGIYDVKTLFLDDEFDDNFAKASENLFNLRIAPQLRVNVFDIVKSDKLIITTKALDLLQERLINQYTSGGKKASYVKKLSDYTAIVQDSINDNNHNNDNNSNTNLSHLV